MQPAAERLDVRPDLHPGRPQCIRRLVGMAGLHPAAAVAALADLDQELGQQHRQRRQVLHDLAGRVGVIDRPATIGAPARQAHRDRPIRGPRRRHPPAPLPVVGALPPPRSRGRVRALALRERGRLPLVLPLPAHQRDFEFRDPFIARRQGLPQFRVVRYQALHQQRQLRRRHHRDLLDCRQVWLAHPTLPRAPARYMDKLPEHTRDQVEPANSVPINFDESASSSDHRTVSAA